MPRSEWRTATSFSWTLDRRTVPSSTDSRSDGCRSGTVLALPLAALPWFSAGTVRTDEQRNTGVVYTEAGATARWGDPPDVSRHAESNVRSRLAKDANPMNPLTLDLIKLAFLAVLWLFVIAA